MEQLVVADINDHNSMERPTDVYDFGLYLSWMIMMLIVYQFYNYVETLFE